MKYIVAVAIKETIQAFQFWNYGSYGINSEHLMMYPRWTPAVQNMSSVKIPKLAIMWEEIIEKGLYLSLLLQQQLKLVKMHNIYDS